MNNKSWFEDCTTEDLSKLVDSGILFKINKQILHVFGMTLTVVYKKEMPVGLKLLKATSGDLVFSEGDYNGGEDKFDRFMNEEGLDILYRRIDMLGFLVQGDENINRHTKKDIIDKFLRGH